jgi:hypothetical protein
MREGLPTNAPTSVQADGSQTAAKSLFWKILPLNPCGSRFCRYLMLSTMYKFLRMRILETRRKKNRRTLFGNWRDLRLALGGGELRLRGAVKDQRRQNVEQLEIEFDRAEAGLEIWQNHARVLEQQHRSFRFQR